MKRRIIQHNALAVPDCQHMPYIALCHFCFLLTGLAQLPVLLPTCTCFVTFSLLYLSCLPLFITHRLLLFLFTLQNELSGNMVPQQGIVSSVRDPCAVRNDCGHLAYHVAVRKGFSGCLTELLDPAVPVR